MPIVKIYVNPGDKSIDKDKLDEVAAQWGVAPSILMWEVHTDSARAVEDALNEALDLNEKPIVISKG